MIPKGTAGIENISARILGNLLPKMDDAYTIADLAIMANLVGMVGQDFDRAADVLISDHKDITEILRDALPHIKDKSLRQRMEATLAAEVPSFRVEALNARGDIAMRVLIDVQDAVEQAQGSGAPWAAALDSRIWKFLDAYVARRAYTISM
jgi:hypothetical protein